MKAARTLVIALLGFASTLAPLASQAASVQVPVPGGHVRLPAPPLPTVVIHEDRAPAPRHYEQRDRRYREEHRHYRHYRRDHHDHGRHGGDHHRH